jgi:hypothetical protein
MPVAGSAADGMLRTPITARALPAAARRAPPVRAALPLPVPTLVVAGMAALVFLVCPLL